MDQKVLAARIGISPQHLSQLETAYSRPGRPPVGPGDDVIQSLSEALNWRVIDIRRVLGQIPDEEFQEFAEDPAVTLLRGLPSAQREKARKMLLAAFAEDTPVDAGGKTRVNEPCSRS